MTYFKLIPALLLLAAPACILDKDLGDTTLDTATSAPGSSSGSSSEPGETSVTGSSESSATSTGEPAELCPGNENTTCTVAFNCLDFPCGGLEDLFDADGCPRARCTDDKPCGAGEVCYDTGAWGTCNASGVFCEDMGDSCSCGVTADCQPVAYCVPAEIGPPADCFAITDADECLAAGCSEASTVIPMTLDGDTCVCGEPEVACLWFTQEEWGSQASPGAFYEIASGKVVAFPGDWIEVPKGWASCDDADDPAACACLETCGGF